MNNYIYYGKQYIEKNDINAVTRVLKSKYLSSGPEIKKLEKNFSKYVNCKYSLTCNSGTSAIFLALQAIGVKKGDNIILPSINFVAAANMCKHLGANIFFADVDHKTYQVSPETILDCIKINKLKKIKLFFTMYLGGASYNIKTFALLKKKLNCFFFEDACHALGSDYHGIKKKIKVGSSIYSDLSIFSFHPVKSITSGEGGMVCTNSKKLFNKIKLLRSHGISSRNKYLYDVIETGFNFRLSDINCALLNSQLKSLNKFVTKRRLIVSEYYKNLKSMQNIRIVNYETLNYSSWHLLIFEMRLNKKLTKRKLYEFFKKKRIILQFHYVPTYKLRNFKSKIKNMINSEKYFKCCFSFPIFYNLKVKDIKYICRQVKKIV